MSEKSWDQVLGKIIRARLDKNELKLLLFDRLDILGVPFM